MKTFENSYDLGYAIRVTDSIVLVLTSLYRRRKNLELFFNLGKDG